MLRSIFTSLLLFAASLSAAEPPPALASLAYAGDQAALMDLDRDFVAAGKDPTKLAALETRLLGILRRKDTTFAARQAVCQRLGLILASSAPKANAKAYKPLDAMLLDERDSDLARLALDLAPGAVVDALFTSALAKSEGRARLGLIGSLGRRHLDDAVPALTKLLADADPVTAATAAHALGEIGTTAAANALRAARNLPPISLAHARLQATMRLPAADALRTLRELQDATGLPVAMRAAAFRRSLDLAPDTATQSIVEVLGAKDWTFKQVAVEALANGIKPEGVRALSTGLSRWDAPTQAAVIAALGRAGDAAAVPAVVTATRHASAEVRAEAFGALGFLPGNGEVVTLLAQAASSGDKTDAKAAKESLARLNGPGVSAAILAGAQRGEAKLRIAYLEQLGLRHMTEGLPLLLQCRSEADAKVRAAAVGALGDLAPFSEQRAILDWAIAATDDTEQTRALRALVNVTLRNPDVAGRGRALYSTLESAQPEVTLRLIPVLPRLGGSASADCATKLALRTDPKIAEAAAAALGRWTDATALPSLGTVAEKATVTAARDTARSSAIRTLERNREAWTPETTQVISQLMGSAKNAAPRKQLLALLARANDRTALQLAETLQSDPALGDDARYAAGAIKASLAGAPKLRASPDSGIANATDGKTSTRWSAPALGEEWVEIDFRLSRPLRRLTLDQTGRNTEFPEQYEVQVTDDPKSPGPAIAQGKGQRNKTVIDLPAGTHGRYVVIKNVVERKDTPWTICELYVD